ncbi:MAG: neutral zinc metallopeptidase [Thermomicrobiales bacterium]
MSRSLVLTLAVVLTLLAPGSVRAQSTAELIYGELDAWWAAAFAERGLAYSSPQLELVSEPGTEFCGFFDVFYAPAGYCAPSREITVSTGFVSPDAVTALLTLVGHEWGHHIQQLTDTGAATPIEQELQADCFAGAFIEYARQSDLVSPVIGTFALQLSQAAGDVWWAVPFDEAIHGTQSDRAIAFMAGQSGGLEACGI